MNTPAPEPKPDICQRTFDFAVRIVQLCNALFEKRGAGEVLARQVLRSGTSIGANVQEAQAAQTKRDFITKMTIAQKESRETAYWLRLLIKAGPVAPTRITALHDEAEQITKIISSIVRTSKSSM